MSVTRIVVALTILTTLLSSIHYYLWARLVRDPVLPEPWGTFATWTLGFLAIGGIAGIVLVRLVPREVYSPIMWVVYPWIGLMFYLFLLLVASDVLLLVRAIGERLAAEGAADPERRTFLARVVATVVSVSALGIGAFGMKSALGRTAVKSVRVPLAKLVGGSGPYRIVQVTDIHIGPTIGEAFIREVVDEVNALRPDCVVITGDLVDGSVKDLGPLAEPLRNLQAKDGVYFVTGNHEYYSGVDEWLAFLTGLGIKVLRNERVAVGPIDLAGVDDWSAKSFGHGHGADIPKALAGRDVSRPIVLLAHQPQAVAEAADHGVDLQLSGHTHGGQLFPWYYAVKLVTPYVAGLYKHKDTALYVSRGTGYWGPPMRVGAPAEITSVELVPA